MSGSLRVKTPFGELEVMGHTVLMVLCAASICLMLYYQAMAYTGALERINQDHTIISNKVGLLVLGQILTEDQKHDLPLYMQVEVQKIIRENARVEVNAVQEKGGIVTK